jgi:hypothetical protein
MSNFQQLGEVVIRGDGDDPTAVISYTDNLWLVTVERRLLAPTGGPTSLTIEPYYGHGGDGSYDLGGYDSAGIQQSDLRAIPMAEARALLEGAWVEHRAKQLIDGIPENFSGDYAFARLAEAFVTLRGWNVNNPIGVIARHRKPNTHGTWATRVKRARERGFITDVIDPADPKKSEPTLTGKALGLLRG